MGYCVPLFLRISDTDVYVHVVCETETETVAAYPAKYVNVSDIYFYKYSRTSMARTPMARLPWLIRTRFWVRTKFFR